MRERTVCVVRVTGGPLQPVRAGEVNLSQWH